MMSKLNGTGNSFRSWLERLFFLGIVVFLISLPKGRESIVQYFSNPSRSTQDTIIGDWQSTKDSFNVLSFRGDSTMREVTESNIVDGRYWISGSKGTITGMIWCLEKPKEAKGPIKEAILLDIGYFFAEGDLFIAVGGTDPPLITRWRRHNKEQ